MKPNKNFELGVEDIEIIENALNNKIQNLSISDVDNTEEIKKITTLLGNIHNQKVWFKPKNQVYISG